MVSSSGILNEFCVVIYACDITVFVFMFSGSPWEEVYRGSAMECVCDGLKPGGTYQARVCCHSKGGQSLVKRTNAYRQFTVLMQPA